MEVDVENGRKRTKLWGDVASKAASSKVIVVSL